jgi:rhodanese-related sulfurtransferase
MDELKRTQRITIAVLVIIGLLAIGYMVRKVPDMPYKLTADEMLKELITAGQVSPSQARDLMSDSSQTVFIDIRSPYDYEVKHIEGAFNIPTAYLLDDENKDFFEQLKKQDKNVILYGETELEATSPWILLREMGYDNVKLLLGGYECINDTGDMFVVETPKYDFAKIANGEGEKTNTKEEKPKPKPKPKKTIPVRKKKKQEAEGGC